MLLAEWLERAAARTPAREALVVDDRRLSYAELDLRVSRLAHALIERGVNPGDRVAIFLETSIESVLTIFAALRAGAAIMPIYHSTKDEKLARLLAHGEPSALIVPEVRRGALPTAGVRCVLGVGSDEWTKIVDTGTPPTLGARAIDQDLAFLIYTSGSTGEPKGVMLTHANVRTAIEAIVSYLHLTADDTLFNLLPLSFGYGLTQLFSAVAVGAKIVCAKGSPFPHVTLTKMVEEKITGLAVVPTIASVLLNLDLSKYDLGTLRYITNAGAALPTEFVARLRAALPNVQLIPMYGQTECLRISYNEPDQVDARPASCGRGMPNQDVWIIDDHGAEVAPGVTGELVVRGGHVMRGYWKNPEETARKLKPGKLAGEVVLHTGDLFKRDAEGFLTFVSRKDEIIKSKGEKVSPKEVEDALYKLDGVTEAAVVGVADPVLGQAVKAFVVLRDGVTLGARQVQAHCAKLLEDYAVPAHVEFRPALPRTTTGKIAKQELK